MQCVIDLISSAQRQELIIPQFGDCTLSLYFPLFQALISLYHRGRLFHRAYVLHSPRIRYQRQRKIISIRTKLD